MDTTNLFNLSPALTMLLLGACIASGPLAWVWWRTRGGTHLQKRHALTALTLFLTFDLVLFGAFTRLTDSGLGCPDWPGCYGSVSPMGATHQIAQAEAHLPTGPVTHSKAWIEMVHRYLATGVGGLILVLAGMAWFEHRKARQPGTEQTAPPHPHGGPGLPLLTLVWVCIQGAFGALTVTMKLYPAIVTLHLMGGFVLLAMLCVQTLRLSRNGLTADWPALSPTLRWWVGCSLWLLMAQVAAPPATVSDVGLLVLAAQPVEFNAEPQTATGTAVLLTQQASVVGAVVVAESERGPSSSRASSPKQLPAASLRTV